MRLTKVLPLFSLILSLAFISLGLLVRPLWYDVNDFLGTTLPVMAILVLLAVVYVTYTWRSFKQDILGIPGSWRHYLAMLLPDLFMLTLLYVFFTELGAEQVMIWRNLFKSLPYVLWLVAVGLSLLRPPRSQNARAAVIIGLILAASIWFALPLRVVNTTHPVVFIQQDGLDVVWGTNMRAVSWLDYGPDANLGSTLQEQEYGLKVIGDQVQSIFLSDELIKKDLFLRTNAEGIRNIYPVDADKAGVVQSEIVQLKLPDPGREISFVAFSDLHEQNSLYNRISEQIDWAQMDLSFYLGDLVNNVSEASQVNRSILNLPTGGYEIPRVFVRGNHEARGEAARSMQNWLVPPEGKFYFTFQAGNAFFIVLDSGEGETDADVEYSGLVDFASYHQQQAAWLQAVLDTPEFKNADYRIVLVHIPPTENPTPEFFPVFSQLVSRQDIDLVVSGHMHEAGIWLPSETGLPFPVIRCGGSSADDMAAVTVHLGANAMELKVIGVDGTVWKSLIISH
jgi:predicted MPP superfamily phosphohydrolase